MFLFCLPVGSVHTYEDAGSTCEEVGSDFLAQYPGGKDHGGDGVEINPVGGFDGSQLGDAPVPREETHHGSQAAQEEQVGKYHGMREHLRGGKTWHHGIIGQNGEYAIEEHLSRDECGTVLVGHRLHEQRIDSPAHTGCESQRIAHRREMEHETAVEHHDDHAYKCQQRTHQLNHMNVRGAIDEPHQQGGEKRTRADDERGVGGGGEVHRLVLAQKVERAARNAQQHHPALIAPRRGEEPTVVETQHQHISHEETKGEYLGWRKAMKHQHLGGDKGGSPYRHSDEGDKMIEKCTVMLCHRDLIKTFAKIMQMSAMKACFLIAECSLSYAKIQQKVENQ